MKSYFIFLSRNKLYTAITICGFAISLMFVILVSIYARDEFKVDAHHEKLDRLYRVQYGEEGTSYTPPAMGPDLAGRYPEIESYTTLCRRNLTITTPREEKLNLDVTIVDSSFFSIFSFELLQGTPTSVMRTERDVVISENLANQIFGSTSAAMGKTIRNIGQEWDLTVSGVFAEIKNSAVMSPDIFLRTGGLYDRAKAEMMFEGYYGCNFTLVLLGKQGADLQGKAQDFTRFLRDERGFWLLRDKFCDTVTLEKFANVYFSTVPGDGTQSGNKRFVFILIAAALAILLFAVINYINLSVAQSGFRAREMATRRLMGSSTIAIFGKFILESVLLCAASFIIALGLASLVQGFFNDMLQTSIDINKEFSASNIAITLSFIGLLGLVSGLVPAFVITKFKPIEVVRGTFSYRTKKVYSKILITFQYIITVFLIGMTTLIVQQTTFMRNIDLGFHTDGLYGVNVSLNPKDGEALRSRLMQVPGVEAVGFANNTPLNWGNNNSFTLNQTQQSFTIYYLDSVCFNLFGFELLSSNGNMSDTAYYINQTGLRNIGAATMPDAMLPDGQTSGYALRGVVKDYHFVNLTAPIGSSIIRNSMWWVSQAIIKSSNPDIAQAIKPVISDFTNGMPFEGRWLDDDMSRWTDKVERQGNLIGSLAMIAIIISALGMLAMATYFIRQRSMEIAVRKVFGATRGEVLGMLMWQFLRLVAVAFVLGAPLIWHFGNSWLEDFPYRVQLEAIVYLTAAVVAFAIASITVFYQAYRAMNTPASAALKK